MKTETKVGLLFVGTLILVAMFMTWLGVIDPFTKSHRVYVLYNFAGGISPGSPVRVMGIKVGKVRDIDFVSNMNAQNGEEAKLKITITVDDKAWESLRQDSQFYINLAGVVGEKYIEITPGSSALSKLDDGGVYRGVDPPRIESMISQSFSLAGKVLDLVEKNEYKIIRLIDNLAVITGDFRQVTKKLNSADTQKSMKIMNKLLEKLDKIDEKTIKKFLQEDGIKAKLF